MWLYLGVVGPRIDPYTTNGVAHINPIVYAYFLSKMALLNELARDRGSEVRLINS